jgi:hypothetical protein
MLKRKGSSFSLLMTIPSVKDSFMKSIVLSILEISDVSLIGVSMLVNSSANFIHLP